MPTTCSKAATPATRGYDIAARYVAAEFRKLGLKPGAGDELLPAVPFVKVGLDKAHPAALTIGGQRFVNGTDSVDRRHAR